MSYLFTKQDANAFDDWYQNSQNRVIIERENQLMFDMIQPARGEHVLGIECGTGQRLFKFLERGLTVTGFDSSDYMIEVAEKNLGNRVDLHTGNPEALPFDDNSFNISVLINTLEFADYFETVIEEAARVTKDRIFIGIWNKFAIKDVWLQIKSMYPHVPKNSIQFYTSSEIKKAVKKLLGDVPVEWKTTGQPGEGGDNMFSRMIEQSNFLKRCPFGTFLGISIILVPSFRLRPLNLKIEKNNEAFAGAT